MELFITFVDDLISFTKTKVSICFEEKFIYLYSPCFILETKSIDCLFNKINHLLEVEPYVNMKSPTLNLLSNSEPNLLDKTNFDLLKYGLNIRIKVKKHIYNYILNYLYFKKIINCELINTKILKIDSYRMPKYMPKNTEKYIFFNYIENLNDIKNFKNVLIIGQLNKEFILCSNKDKLIIMDQHAIHERIRLENFFEKYKNLAEKKLDFLKEKACKGAIKFGMQLENKKIKKLIDDLSVCNYPTICAHGRPSIAIFKIGI
ncbi:DNA mismatch repair protein [Gurleya vavrai]